MPARGILWLRQALSFDWRKLVFINSTLFHRTHHEARKTFLRDVFQDNIMKMRRDFSFEVFCFYLTMKALDILRRFRSNLRSYRKGFQRRWKNRKARTDLRNLNSSLKRRLPYSDSKTRNVLFRRRVSLEKTLNDKPSTFYDCWELNWGYKLS